MIEYDYLFLNNISFIIILKIENFIWKSLSSLSSIKKYYLSPS